MPGIELADLPDDFALRRLVDLGDEVVAALGRDLQALEPIHAADDDFAGAACGANGDVEERVGRHLL